MKRKRSEDSNLKAKKKPKLDEKANLKPASKARKKQAKKQKKNVPKQKTLLNFFKKKSSS